jgi:hypothetical protein
MLPYSHDQKRPLLCSILDCELVFIRHSIRKRLDIETYMCAPPYPRYARRLILLAQRCPAAPSQGDAYAQIGPDPTRL